jgi:hypothetical protein
MIHFQVALKNFLDLYTQNGSFHPAPADSASGASPKPIPLAVYAEKE